MPRYAMVIDQSRCIGCMACVVSCKRENDVPPEVYRTRVLEIVQGDFPDLTTEMRSELCNHCDNAPCVNICPTGASHYEEDGTVQIDRDKCVAVRPVLPLAHIMLVISMKNTVMPINVLFVSNDWQKGKNQPVLPPVSVVPEYLVTWTIRTAKCLKFFVKLAIVFWESLLGPDPTSIILTNILKERKEEISWN
ncbi:4Fe-4S binding domain-containing protein [Candidatus Electrothrix aarhusensis]|uniref:4Fe-4S binding domain-containing protein n=1 Tax=Candidatus Electrothrix aarhusensis TaxID=1859131 RepID=A0A3S3SMA5_9BACT|nr:4Fe-4S binding domain-containing protein [Candidatus Electrothrix aarhusensis]